MKENEKLEQWGAVIKNLTDDKEKLKLLSYYADYYAKSPFSANNLLQINLLLLNKLNLGKTFVRFGKHDDMKDMEFKINISSEYDVRLVESVFIEHIAEFLNKKITEFTTLHIYNLISEIKVDNDYLIIRLRCHFNMIRKMENLYIYKTYVKIFHFSYHKV